MTEPNLPDCLTVSLGLRVPVFEKDKSPREKIDELESYLLLSAYTQGELTEERMTWLVGAVVLQMKWDHLDGWQHLRRTRTELAVRDAKRQIAPELYDRLQANEWMVKRLSEEIDRMERDATKISRAYTMITGAS
jgi:hypothetical protein